MDNSITFRRWAINEGLPVGRDSNGNYPLLTKVAYDAWQKALDVARMECLNLRHEDFSAESEDWKKGTFDCANALGRMQVASRYEKVSS